MAKTITNEIFIQNQNNSSIGDYISLLKPRVMSLVVFSSLVGMYLSPSKIHPFIAFVSILFTSIGSGAAASLNMWYDRDIDAIMTRTQNRAIVRGAVDESDALMLGISLSIISVIGMIVCVNLLSGFILAFSIGFYYFIYTVWLKRTSVQNIVIGGAAGAFPPMIGWASAENSLSLDPFILFLIIFLWTPPHFWALALYKSDDYKKAKVPMMPVIYGSEKTKKQILIYTILMITSTLMPYMTGIVGNLYLFPSFILNAYFLYLVMVLKFEADIKTAPKVFGYSIIYLFLLFGIMMLDKFMG